MINQGKIAFKRGDYAGAVQFWEEQFAAFSATDPLRAKLSAALAEANFRRGQQIAHQDPAEALKLLLRTSALQPADPLYRYHAALATHRSGALDQAITLYRETLAVSPTFKRAAYPLVLALGAAKRNVTGDPAWALLNESERARIERRAPNDPIAEGLSAYAAGNFDQAEARLSSAANLPATTTPAPAIGVAEYYLGALAGRRGDSAGALQHWTLAFERGLDSLSLRNNLVLGLTVESESALLAKTTAEALDSIERGLIVAPVNKRLLDMQGYIQLKSGYEWAQRGNWEKALLEWDKVENASGANARYLAANRAIAYEKLENLTEAAEAWRDFVRRRPRTGDSGDNLTPEQVGRMWSRIASLHMKAGDPDEAISSLQTALKYQPDDPKLGLALTGCYIGAHRIDAAFNQIDRVLKSQPKHIEALVLKAELSESAPRRGFYNLEAAPGTTEWENVLATGDETYRPIARERLAELYDESIDGLDSFGGQPQFITKICERAIAHLPDNHYLRARYVFFLLKWGKKNFTKARELIAQIDFADLDAMQTLVRGWLNIDEHDEARAVITKADAIKPLLPDFFLDLGEGALDAKQPQIAETYFAEALRRCHDTDPRARLTVQTGIATIYVDHKQAEKAVSILTEVLKADPAFVSAQVALAFAYFVQGDIKRGKQILKDAERAARKAKNQEMLEEIRQMQRMINSPFMGMFGSPFGGGSPPMNTAGFPDIFGAGAFDEDDFDDDNFDFGPPGWIDPAQVLDNLPDYAPETDSRRRRRQKREAGGSSDPTANAPKKPGEY